MNICLHVLKAFLRKNNMKITSLINKVAREVFGINISRVEKKKISPEERIDQYLNSGRIPWSIGYNEYKWNSILKSINDFNILEKFRTNQLLPEFFGLGVDDRSVEYPWIFSNIKNGKGTMLDAGSTFNYASLVELPIIKTKELTILTYFPEAINFNSNRISYLYSDLRDIPLKDNLFDEVICQSTIEHIGMDNSMYGYNNTTAEIGKAKDYSYLDAITELVRVIKPKGQLLLTFPFGKYEFHGFFQQFDKEMLGKMKEIFDKNGKTTFDFFQYKKEGWFWSDIDNASNSESYNPHTGVGKGDDGAAHSRAICCVKFVKG